ncbi:MAG TPA: hypothetical protein VF594_11725 [Rubricoccaceae bacterium]|jgi:hypothetical protein
MSVFQKGTVPSYAGAAAGLRAAALFLLVLAAAAPQAQPARTADALADARTAAERAHLWRVGAWGAANVAAGAVLLATASGRAQQRAFGVQAAAWGAVNTGIAVVALARAAADTTATLGEALRAEAHLADVLWLNVGLDAGYMAVGATLWLVASRGVANGAAWRGHGQAVLLQGAALLALDAVVLAGSSGRFEALARLADAAVLVPAAVGPGMPGVLLVVGL